MKNLKKVKNTLKISERDHSSSPYYSSKNIPPGKSKDPVRALKTTKLIKDFPPNNQIFTIISCRSNEKNLKFQKLLPKLGEKPSLSSKLNNVNIILNTENKPLKHLALNEELDENTKLLSEKSEYKSKTWLENLISLKERKSEGATFVENLKFSNSIIRDIICRLKTSGKDNESILLEKIWRLSLEFIDGHIEIIEKNIERVDQVTKNTIKVHNQVEKIKSQCESKVIKLEKVIQRVKLDYILAKDPRTGDENKRILKIKPFVENVYNQIELLSDMYLKGKVPVMNRKRRAGSNRPELSQIKLRRKKSMEFLGFNLLDEFEYEQ
jgi:hypothetical protein